MKSEGTDTAVNVSIISIKYIFKHQELPDSIVPDLDSKFKSDFLNRLLIRSELKLRISPSQHPQTDGANYIKNDMAENYIHCYFSYDQHVWDELLTSAEIAYNSSI